MNVEYFIPELIKRLYVVDLLPNKVARVVVYAEIIAGQQLKHFAPKPRCGKQVLPARPLIRAEKHGAVFNCNLNALFLGKLYNRRPNFLK